jgi:diadenosine tetraphosphate (Ap4A) HIT family hydrolase
MESTIIDCPFCNLGKRILKENELAYLFLSNPRKVPGHFLVTPKRHIEKPWEMTEQEMKSIFELILFAQKKLVDHVSEGSDVLQHYRPFMKQGRIKVNHIHYHILPRDFNDKIYQVIEKYETEAFYEELTDDEYNKMKTILE